jgi:hypothetical protein
MINTVLPHTRGKAVHIVDQEIDHLIHQDQSPRLHGKEDDDTIL